MLTPYALSCQEKDHQHSHWIAINLLRYRTERINTVGFEIRMRIRYARVFVHDKLNVDFYNAFIALIYLESRTENQTAALKFFLFCFPVERSLIFFLSPLRININ